MKTHDSNEHARRLRQAAEEQVIREAVQSPRDLEGVPAQFVWQTIHELRIHQIELQMQNEELRRTQNEMAFNIYDLAPIGYLTVNTSSIIQQANLTSATLLDTPRARLIGLPLSRFIIPADQDTFYLTWRLLQSTTAPQTCELRLLNSTAPHWVKLHLQTTGDPGQFILTILPSENHKHAKNLQSLALQTLHILNVENNAKTACQQILTAIKQTTKLNAVGLRLNEGDNYAYLEADTFNTPNTELCHDPQGRISPQCTCASLLEGQSITNITCTAAGSAWSNNTQSLIAKLPNPPSTLIHSNHCIFDGFQSVAIIPIRRTTTILGLLQLSDQLPHRFTIEDIHFFEGIANALAIAIARFATTEN